MPEPTQSPIQTSTPPSPTTSTNGTPWIASVAGVRDEYKGLSSLKSYKDINGLLSSHIALEKKMGSAVNVPGPEATDEERNTFYSKMGRPESADKYTFNAKEITEKALGKDFPVNEPFIQAAKSEFHKLGLTDSQARGLVEMYTAQQKLAIDGMSSEVEKGVGALKSEWGHAYDSNVALCERAVNALSEDVPELKDFFADPRNGSNPALLKLFTFLGKAMGEDTARTGQETLPSAEANTIKVALDDQMNNPNNPDYKALHDSDHPMHRKVVEARAARYKELYPEPGAPS